MSAEERDAEAEPQEGAEPEASAEGAEGAAAEAPAEEAKPEPRRARKPRAQAEGTPAEDEGDAPAEDDAADAGADAPDDEAAAERRSGARRRGAAETSTSPGGAGSRRRDRRAPAEPVTVRASARYVRTAPRKARLVIDHIRGKSVAEARAILVHTPRAASRDVLKLLESCVANAEANHELGADELRVERAFVDEGPTIKRFRPRAQGRATRIRKRTSHMTIHLTNQDA